MDPITFNEALANLPNQHPIEEWWHAHYMTQLIEMPIYIVLLYWAFKRWWVVIPLSVFVNVATHPALWYLFPFWTLDGSWMLPLLPERLHRNAPYYCWLLIAECCVFMLEGHIVAGALVTWGHEKYRSPGFAIGYGLLAAFLANIPSTLAGLIAS